MRDLTLTSAITEFPAVAAFRTHHHHQPQTFQAGDYAIRQKLWLCLPVGGLRYPVMKQELRALETAGVHHSGQPKHTGVAHVF